MIAAAPRFRFSGAIYPIVDAAQSGRREPLELAKAVLDGGAAIVQLRAKELSTREACELAGSLSILCQRYGAGLIVNDRADVALLVGATGVHLGQSDLPPEDARRILGPAAVIGYSTHHVEQVRQATALGCVDYLGFGPIYPTTSKGNPDPCQGVEGLQQARAATTLPLVAIGGITAATAAEVIAAGADAVAMIGALAAAADPTDLIRSLQHLSS